MFDSVKGLQEFLDNPTENGFELKEGDMYHRDSDTVYLPLFKIGHILDNKECLELHACKTCSVRGVHVTSLKDFFYCSSCKKLIHVSMLKPVKYSNGTYIDA